MPPRSRRLALDEIMTLLGAFGGSVALTWPLLVSPTDDAPWSGLPSSISGLGVLMLAWAAALAGAKGMLMLVDLIACCYTAASERRCRTVRRWSGTSRDSFDSQPSNRSLDANPEVEERGVPLVHGSPRSVLGAFGGARARPDGATPTEARDESLTVGLSSNGTRPCMRTRFAAFVDGGVAEAAARDTELSAGGESKAGDAGKPETKEEVLVAAGGPKALFASLEKALPDRVHVTRLTHPM